MPSAFTSKSSKRNGRGAIVRGLGGGMDDEFRPQFLHQRQDALAVADVQGVVASIPDASRRSRSSDPTGVAVGSEKNGSMVIVDAADLVPLAGEKNRNLRSDQPAGTGNQNTRHPAQFNKRVRGDQNGACAGSGRFVEFVFPELLEVFERIGADGLQIEAEQIPETEPLLPGEILIAFERHQRVFCNSRSCPATAM